MLKYGEFVPTKALKTPEELKRVKRPIECLSNVVYCLFTCIC